MNRLLVLLMLIGCGGNQALNVKVNGETIKLERLWR